MTKEFCSEHKTSGMVDITSKRCGHHGDTKQPSLFGAEGNNKREFYSENKKDGVVGIIRKNYGHRDCTKQPSFGVEGSKTEEFCSEHKMGWVVNLKSKKRQVRPPRLHLAAVTWRGG